MHEKDEVCSWKVDNLIYITEMWGIGFMGVKIEIWERW